MDKEAQEAARHLAQEALRRRLEEPLDSETGDCCFWGVFWGFGFGVLLELLVQIFLKLVIICNYVCILTLRARPLYHEDELSCPPGSIVPA